MYAIPQSFLRTLANGRGVDARLNGSVDGSEFGVPMRLLAGGQVTVDGTSDVRRTLSCSVAASITDPAVDPFTAEVFAESAIITPQGAEFWVPLGVFVVTGAEEEREGVVKLTTADRWQRIKDSRFERPVVTSGSTVAAIQSLVEGADYRLVGTFVDETGDTSTHKSSLWERDRDDAVKKLAASIGAEVFFDPQGVPRLRYVQPLPAVGAAADWQIGRGRGGAKISAKRRVSREFTYNAVAASAEPKDGAAPVMAVARDTAPTSPTFWGGPFGKKTRFYRSSLLSTTAQCSKAAQAILNRSLGAAWSIGVEAVPHPGLDAGDVVSVEVADGLWEPHLVDGLSLPLGADAMSITTRTTAEAVEES